jgi:lactoylglutathione lyase
MHKPTVAEAVNQGEAQFTGYSHLTFSVGSKEQVDALTSRLRTDGYQVIGDPRYTGDGYYESIILDPEGNRIEITV